MRHTTTIIRTAATAATVALLTMAPATAALATEATADQGDGSTLIWKLATKLPVPEDPCADYEQQLVEDDPTGSIPPELLSSYDEDCEDGNAAGGGEEPTDDPTDPEPGEDDEAGEDGPGGEDEAGVDETTTDDPGDTDPTPVPTSGTEPSSGSSAGGEGQDGEAQDEGDSTSSRSEAPAPAPPDDEDAVTTASTRLDTASAPEVYSTPLATPTAGETRRSPVVLALALGLSGALLMGSGVAAGHALAARRR